ncbi:hypothetical protein [Bacillus sp. V3-13]|uniref:hypothetical protein n=1 Tax=Bacillus sp. V3-13 TaxID=2053728 RepID=UPI0015E07027|nr:hypothetical protein [Bacillus sp. V3-13]
MEKDNLGQKEHRNRSNEEVLEISSTGYGLESVSKDTEEHEVQTSNNRNSSCGGL